MKAEELMIGDLVRIPVSKVDGVTTSNGIARIVSIHSGDWCIVKSDVGYTLSIDYTLINPIPLDTEILEKNGFEKELTEDGIHYRFTLISDNIKFSLLYARSVFQWLGPMDFKYVHELQHVLRLCGIKKEIKL